MEKNTVADLIELLKTMNPESVVYLEGCDCTGQWSGGAKERPDEKTVELHR